VYKEYSEFYSAAVDAIDAEMKQVSAAEARWTDHWLSSVDKLKQLYSHWPRSSPRPHTSDTCHNRYRPGLKVSVLCPSVCLSHERSAAVADETK